MDIVLIYSGLGLIEDTSVSEGRGTTKPFQMTGNPNVNARDILQYFKNNVSIIKLRVKPLAMARPSTSGKPTLCPLSKNTWAKYAVEPKCT